MVVLVSGATGFIAQHIVDHLLQANYKVIGTVRSQEKADRLHGQFGNHPGLEFEIVADISDPAAFDDIFRRRGKEIDVVLHTSSPMNFHIIDYDDGLLKPAVNGVRGILNSIKKYAADDVERVVITSSFAANFVPNKLNDKTAIFTERDWNPDTWEDCRSDAINVYCASKKFAEQEAWKFWQENKDVVKFKLSTVSPAFVFGPQLFDEDARDHLNSSNQVINGPLHSKPGEIVEPEFRGEFVDVRDLAKAHLLAFEMEDTAGQRLGLSGGAFNTQMVVDILHAKFPQLNGKISGGGRNAKEFGCVFDTSFTKSLLGLELNGLEKVVYDTAAQILTQDGRT